MCGIVGVLGAEDAGRELLVMLRRLDYRGYDSAGLAILDETGSFRVWKKKGHLEALEADFTRRPFVGHRGIGHTRWATHGPPTDVNAHPHLSASGRVAVVHNGIIENYAELRSELRGRGHEFVTETDTEVLIHLADEFLCSQSPFDAKAFVQFLTARIRGAYALVFQFSDLPDALLAIRYECPLYFSQSTARSHLSSDITSLVSFSGSIGVIRDGQALLLTRDGHEIFDFAGTSTNALFVEVTWSTEDAQKGGYAHFVRKEIDEQPQAVRALATSIMSSRAAFRALVHRIDPDRIYFLACGSAAFTCVFGEILARYWRFPISVANVVGSEFRYKPPLMSERTVVFAMSQSGETADTIQAAQRASEKGATLVSFVNVAGSTLDLASNLSISLGAGPEVAVPSTKAVLNHFVCAIAALSMIGEGSSSDGLRDDIEALARAIEKVLMLDEQLQGIARLLSGHQSNFTLGRGLDYPIALEASLKLKETAYIHSEAMYAGEFKHGSISLIEHGMPVLCFMGDKDVRSKTVSNIEEVRARGAQVIIFDPSDEPDQHLRELGEYVQLPALPSPWASLVQVPAVQLIAYHCGVIRAVNVDRPRNLAKSVTVE